MDVLPGFTGKRAENMVCKMMKRNLEITKVSSKWIWHEYLSGLKYFLGIEVYKSR